MQEHNSSTFRESLHVSSDEYFEMGRVGAMFFEQGNLHKARTIFEGLVEMDQENAAAQSALGAVLTLNQQDQDAIIHLENAIRLEPTIIAPYVNLGEVLIRQMRLEEAVASLKGAIELDPDQTDSGANRARAMLLGIYRIIKIDDKSMLHKNKK